MKCLYYLTATLNSVRDITDDLHQAGINDWFIHALSKDEDGLAKHKIHSSNYLEQLDLLRYGITVRWQVFLRGLSRQACLRQANPSVPKCPAAFISSLLFLSPC